MTASTPRRLYRISSSTNAEDAELYKAGGLHPVYIGDSLKEDRYRIVHKLGFGSFSTVWLARDTHRQCYVSLKISRADFRPDSNELKILRYLAKRDFQHEGSQYVMKLMDDFVISGPNGNHNCLVTQVAGNRVARPPGVNYSCLGPSRLLISQMFLALDYLNACNIGHGGKYISFPSKERRSNSDTKICIRETYCSN
jgi:serine/threonine-protein kinase SRPK3